MGIKDKFHEIIDMLAPGHNKGESNSQETENRNQDTGTESLVTNQVLYNELLAHFKHQMNSELSFEDVVLYPMSFNILMHPDDFNRIRESLAFIIPRVIKGFYGAIKEKRDSIFGAKAEPPATYWFFQFASGRVKTQGKQEFFIKPGEIVTVANLFTYDIKKAQQNPNGTRTERSGLSIKCQNSNVNENNINMDALLGMEIVANNTFMYNFDKKMSQLETDIQSSQIRTDVSFATFSYSDENYNFHIPMESETVFLSGPSDNRPGVNIIKINNDAVVNGHVQIQYDKDSNKFRLCAFAKARLNEVKVPLSEGGTVVWVDMSYKSTIFLNDTVKITFEASQEIISRGSQS